MCPHLDVHPHHPQDDDPHLDITTSKNKSCVVLFMTLKKSVSALSMTGFKTKDTKQSGRSKEKY